MRDPLLQRNKSKTGDTRFNRAVVADVAPEATAQETTDRLWEVLRGKEKEAVISHLREVGWKYDPVARIRGAVVFEKDKRRLLVWFGKKGTVSMVGSGERVGPPTPIATSRRPCRVDPPGRRGGCLSWI